LRRFEEIWEFGIGCNGKLSSRQIKMPGCFKRVPNSSNTRIHKFVSFTLFPSLKLFLNEDIGNHQQRTQPAPGKG
jgi:hypothetical protein